MSDRTHADPLPAYMADDGADEKMVLGSLVSYPAETVALLGGALEPDLFFSLSGRTMFDAANALLEAGAPLTIISLTQWLREHGQLDAVGGPYEVTRLATEFGCSPAVAEYHLQRLRNNAALRLGYQTAEWLSESSKQWGADPAEIVAGMMERIERIRAVQDAGDAPAACLGSLPTADRNDGTCLLGNRYVCRGGGALLVGPTGIGKSSFSMQAVTSWALGKPCFGIAPSGPLRSLLIQAENDAGDLAEMRDGVFAGLGLNEADRQQAGERIHCFHDDARSGQDFFTHTVEPLLRLHRPDLLWIDPALSYIGGESNSQEDVGRFLRNWLNPLLRRYQCAAVVVHHTNKPPAGKEKSEWSGSDLAYLGSGSAEWANWARAVIAIRGLGANGVFELCLGKRGGRVGWRNEAGEPVYSTLIGHAKEPGRIYWRSADESERPGGAGESGKRFTVANVIEHIPVDGLKTAALQRVVCAETGMSRANFYKLLEEGSDTGRLRKEKHSQLWVVQMVQTKSK